MSAQLRKASGPPPGSSKKSKHTSKASNKVSAAVSSGTGQPLPKKKSASPKSTPKHPPAGAKVCRRVVACSLALVALAFVAGQVILGWVDRTMIYHQVWRSEAVPCASEAYLEWPGFPDPDYINPSLEKVSEVSEKPCRIVTGPVLGPNGAVLIETSRDVDLTLELHPAQDPLRPWNVASSQNTEDHNTAKTRDRSNGKSDTGDQTVVSQTLRMRAGFPRVFRFPGHTLAPNTYYRIKIANPDSCALDSSREREMERVRILHRLLAADPETRQVMGIDSANDDPEKLPEAYRRWLLLGGFLTPGADGELTSAPASGIATASALATASIAAVSCNNHNVTRDRAAAPCPQEGDLNANTPATLPERTSAVDLWIPLARRVARGQLALILHLGDQVYVDGARHSGPILPEQWLAALPDPSQWPRMGPRVRSLYAELYRRTWSHPPTAFVLSHVANVMQFDDHEMRDDLADRVVDRTPGSAEWWIQAIGRRVMHAYQRQLIEPLAISESSEDSPLFDKTEPLWSLDLYPMQAPEVHLLRFGRLGLLVLDNHGGRAWAQNSENNGDGGDAAGEVKRELVNVDEEDPLPYLGSQQWALINASLLEQEQASDTNSESESHNSVNENHSRARSTPIVGRIPDSQARGAFADVSLLLVVAPMPLVTVSPAVTHTLGRSHDDFLGSWAAFAERGGAEQSLIVEVLREWRLRGNSEDDSGASTREVLLIGGDLHQAGFSDVQDGRTGELLLRQLVSSPISQQAIHDWQIRLLTFLCQLWDTMPAPRQPQPMRFNHYHVTRANNFALLDLVPVSGQSKDLRDSQDSLDRESLAYKAPLGYRARLVASDPDDRRRLAHEHRFVESLGPSLGMGRA